MNITTMSRPGLVAVTLLLAVTVVATAQIRTWTFEQSGKTIEGEIVDFQGNSVLLKTPEGKTFSVAISYLIESDRAYLGAKRKQSDEEAADRARDRMSWSYDKRLIKGTVLQKIPEGLFVSSGADIIARELTETHHFYEGGTYTAGPAGAVYEGDEPGSVCLGLVLLVDFDNYSTIVDGDKVEVMGCRVGTHSYTTAQGSMKTVRRFTASISNFEQRMARQKPERKQINEIKSPPDSYNHIGPSRTIVGKVIQKLSNGLLVDSGVYAMIGKQEEHVYHGGANLRSTMGTRWNASMSQVEQTTKNDESGALYVGLVLLVDFSKYPEVVDDDFITALAYPVGEYSYTTAQNSQRTVRKFSAKP